MRPRFFLCLALAVTPALALGWPRTAAAQNANPPPALPANAAIQYWQAFAQMPTLDKDQEKLLGAWNTVPLDGDAKKLIDASQSSLLYLHRGAKIEACDWGLDYNDGISLMLPHLAKARDLARLAALRTRYHFEQGNSKAARADATAIMALGRHVGRDPIMICVLVRHLIEGTAVDAIAPYVHKAKAPHDQVLAMHDALPRAATLEESIRFEKQYFAAWMIKKLREEEQRQPGAGQKLWKNFLEGSDVPEKAREIESVDKATELMEQVLPVYDELAKLVALPYDEFQAHYPKFKEETKAANPLAGTLLPAIDKIYVKDLRGQTRLKMLIAAVALVTEGPDKLQEIKDPFGTGPFEYRKLDQGFELKSKLVVDGQPVTMTFGQGAAE